MLNAACSSSKVTIDIHASFENKMPFIETLFIKLFVHAHFGSQDHNVVASKFQCLTTFFK